MRKKLSELKNFRKSTLIVFSIIITVIILFYFLSFISQKLNPPAESVVYGVTFSPIAVTSLNLDWKQVYSEMLTDLKVKKVRIPSYWPTVEPLPDQYDFEQVDYMVDTAAQNNAEIVLAIGHRQPRWPECHTPNWAMTMDKGQRQEKVKQLITKVVERYKDNPTIVAFQVENEPLFPIWATFCDNPDEKFFKSEVALVRSLTDKKIITSASGEWDNWIPQMQVTDVVGISLYRDVHNKYTGYFSYPLIPGYYSLKANFSKFFAPSNQKIMVTELQTEPWFGDYDPLTTSVETQKELFSIQDFEDNIDYVKKTSFDEVYLWGVEWWYLMKQKDEPEYWDYAKLLINR